jgi:hypothetical protein
MTTRTKKIAMIGRKPTPVTGSEASAVLDRLLQRHRGLIVRSAAGCDEADREEAMIEGVHGLMDAMALYARGDQRSLDAICAECVVGRVADLALSRALPLAA